MKELIVGFVLLFWTVVACKGDEDSVPSETGSVLCSSFENMKVNEDPSEVYDSGVAYKNLDGTMVVNKNFCDEKDCLEWVKYQRENLGESYIFSTECGEISDDDIAYSKGCNPESSVQLTCRYSENKNLTPESCLEHVDEIIESSDDLGNCLSDWAFEERGAEHHQDVDRNDFSKLKTFSSKLKEIYSCLNKDFPDDNECLFNLAKKHQERRLCLIRDEDYGDRSLESCMSQIKK